MQKNWQDEASFGDFIISHLLSCSSTRIQKKILFELVRKRRMLNRQVFNNNLYRLKKKGMLDFSNRDIIFNKNTLRRNTLFAKIQAKPAGDTKVMVLFDIPEKKRKIRNWLRLQLKLWDFEMLQQSVWLGKGPLPKDFTIRLDLLGVGKCVKIFKIESIKA
ncbi:MAG: hypothetical protein UR90_C0002G0020 [Parcubacteria group bacterium GW2011_GWC1_35_8]|uniref:Transcriptional repressor PaaX-like central Cas2-like domain-containing protein n=3 Tax=Candidatus Nomuraibacteriota TaxID=1752729 RepID=A0A1F6YWD5_9BACT|nr:MAG: hypothetical protein UR90_C0002G0020 [Parcubacteria group bacterium GW2011_GWC1_35_8]KKP88167.1 MAG: hypothetical protein UR91_C0025G0008 [Candidatus Nomurabacteria bacterium GW2011_GWC2_35_8]OGJ06088.1 MAG: hypothetical protein A2238_00740 [Candidatus Nomurabacteria bacterium RIFOXYA2_FULL_35_9]OGJ06862.1 MAG: hypothetical protein A2192_01125 [Candidatus Nomurabacteria bacterium RIFOXYA1_FULL_35_17]OGJ10667.1 MAG: hypothetical protein A2456_00455 [Candidatus Nomurabacteria bacterium RI